MSGERAEAPLVSVVLPVRNEARDISRCLDAILRQDYPRDRMEILVVDGMSSDATRDVVADYARKDSRVRLIDNPGLIVPKGLNEAIRALRGDLLVRVDGHTVIAPDYVTTGVEAIRRSGADVVGGTMVPVGASPFGRSVAAATSTPMGVGGSALHYATDEADAESVYMGTFRRDVFTRFGGFDERCVRNQDDEFNYRVREGGGRVRLVPSMRSTYFPRETPRALFRQYYQYGYFKVLVAGLHPRMMRPRHFAPSAFVAGGTALALASVVSPAARGALAAALGAHLVATLALARARCRGDARAWLLTPAATLLIHWGYGLGFLAGCLGALAGRAPGSSRGLLGRAP
ncbi:MAG TPA: glycosyltransferase family 2 protein [Verrucomicrobiae bacterium]|nr:glycosyltransferase family 2 protein [Verrucomicrobiae bacterium]